MPRKWRCAVLGVGVIGIHHLRAVAQLENAQPVAVCDALPDRARASLQEWKFDSLPVYSDVREMLAKERLDVLHVCTPSGAHMEPSLAAMEAGVNVISEKPLEVTLQRIDRMIETAEKHKVRLAGIFQSRWSEASRALKAALDQNRFGRVAWGGCFTPWFRTDAYYAEGNWRGTWKLDGGGAMMNQSIHAVDLLQWLLGPVRRLSAYAGRRIHAKIEVEDTLSCSLQFASGAYGTIMGSTAIYPSSPVRIELGGENGSAVFEDGLRAFKFRAPQPEDQQLLDRLKPGLLGSLEGGLVLHARNIEAVLRAWDEGRDADTSGREARKAVALVLAMYESAKRNGEPVDLS